MSGRVRRRVYGPDKEFKLYSDDAKAELRVVGRISGDVGERMVRNGEAVRVESGGGLILAYQRCIRAPRAQEIVERCSPASSSAFSRAEVEAIVGLRGRSRTAELSDGERRNRVANGKRGEDFVESARNKFAVYKKTH